MRVTATISGLDAMKLGTPLRQALLDALRARVASMPRPPDAIVEISSGRHTASMPNGPPH